MSPLREQLAAAMERVRHEHRLAPLVAPVLRENYRRNLPWAAAATGLDQLAGALAGEPAILVAAGPSLDEAASALRSVAGRALLLCVDTAVRRLALDGVRPDLVLTIDPHRASLRHFEGLEPAWPLAFLPSAFPEVVARHRGKKLVAFPRGDRLGERLQLVAGKGLVGTAGTVSYFGIEIALRLGCDPLIFVGLDLALRGGRHHCSGAAAYDPARARLRVPGQTGGEVETTAALDRFRHAIELRIAEELPRRRFVNTSLAGARITGALSCSLEAALARWCAARRGTAERLAGRWPEACSPEAVPPRDWQQAWRAVLGEEWAS